MNKIYKSNLHKFVEEYFKLTGVDIIEKQKEYFVVSPDKNKKDFYTYLPRIAAENKEIKLLAKGSKWLREMIKECSFNSAFSEAYVPNTEKTIRNALKQKKCCDLCPFGTVCEGHDTCCDLCYFYKKCNTWIENAYYLRTEKIKESSTVDIACFIFFVEISNDYSLSQKISKTVPVLFNLETGEIIDNLLVNDIEALDFIECKKTDMINKKNYPVYLKKARAEAAKTVQKQLEVFRKNIEDVLGEKIDSIVNKFEEEYVDNYTTSTLKELQQMQEEGLRLCEREISGYTINCDYHLKNVSIFHAKKEIRDLVFKHEKTGKDIVVEGEVFLTRVDLKCSQCGMEIDTGVLCSNGHILCRNCKEVCADCRKVLCDICGRESYVCSTCGNIICNDCSVKCARCGSLQCKAHAYICDVCGKRFCIDCYEVCKVCGKNICMDHVTYCKQCGEPVCPQHAHKCSVCGENFCSDHIEKCDVCGELICDNHTNYSAFSGRIVCEEHYVQCDVCGDKFASDEIRECSECEEKLCPNHIRKCKKCGKIYCSRHVNYCRSCGNEYCSCTSFVKCKFCGEEYCENCINSNGYCKACEELVYVEKEDSIICEVSDKLPGILDYNKFYIGKSKDIRVLYAKKLLKYYMVVFNKEGEILKNKDISLMDNIRRRNRIVKKGRKNQ